MGDDVARLARELRMACMKISRRVRFEGTLEVPPHQYSVLIHLEDGPRTPGDLATVERVTAPSMTRTLNCLEDAELVVREDDPADGRQKLVRLTEDGRALVVRTREQRNSWMHRHLESLDEVELAELERAVGILAKVASAE